MWSNSVSVDTHTMWFLYVKACGQSKHFRTPVSVGYLSGLYGLDSWTGNDC